jgi:hypothetical protein
VVAEIAHRDGSQRWTGVTVVPLQEADWRHCRSPGGFTRRRVKHGLRGDDSIVTWW